VKLRIDLDGKRYELDVEILEEDRAAQRPRYLPHHAPATTLRSGQSHPASTETAGVAQRDAAAVEDGDRVCQCPLSGVVNHIAVSVGQELKPNDLIMVLEAMKMETNVVSDREGTVGAIRVSVGDGVTAGQVLVEYQ